MARKASSSPARPLDASCRVALLSGKDAFLRSEYTAQLKDRLAEAHGGVDVFRFDGEKDEAADILDECRSFGLMSAHKMVVVDNAEAFVKEANRPLVERYTESPCDGATLVLRAERWHKGRLDKLIEAVGVIQKCDELTPDIAAKWCAARTKKRHDATIERAAVLALLDRHGPNLGRLDTELAKLAVAAGPGGTITAELVHSMSAGSRELEPWRVQEPLLSGDAPHAIDEMRRITDSAPREVHVPMTMAAAQLAANLHALAAGGNANRAEIGASRKIYGPRLHPIASAAGRGKPAAFHRLLDEALDADMKGKSGVGKPEITLEVLAVRFAQTLR